MIIETLKSCIVAGLGERAVTGFTKLLPGDLVTNVEGTAHRPGRPHVYIVLRVPEIDYAEGGLALAINREGRVTVQDLPYAAMRTDMVACRFDGIAP